MVIRHLVPLLLCAALALGAAPAAHAAGAQAPAPLSLDGAPLALEGALVQENTTYVPLRALAARLLPAAAVTWEEGRAVLRAPEVTLTAVPGEHVLTCNGVAVGLSAPVLLENYRTLVPVRPLAAALGAEVSWAPATGASLSTRESDQVYWLSRIISAESRGEPFAGQIAVGNVVLNRAAHPDFPDTVYGVIFDERWGGQFEPVRNGTVYADPAPSCVLAARLCLAGANTAGDSLYFLAPALTDNHWTMETQDYVTTIGAHWFYQ